MGALVGAAFAARGAALATRAPRGRRARQRARGMAAPASAAELCGGAPLAAGDEAALRVGLRAVELACELTASVQESIASADAKQSKSDASPVTVADYGAQALVSAALATAAAEAGAPPPALVAEETSAELLATDVDGSVLTRITALVNEAIAGMGKGEETGLTTMNEADVLAAVDQGGGTGGGSGEFWVLDPIDGTKGFLRGQQYAVALALVRDGQLALGVMGCPNFSRGGDGENGEGCMFYAVHGAGAYASPMRANGSGAERVRADAAVPPARARLAESHGTSVVSAHGTTAQVAKKVGLGLPPLQMDSMAKYASVACGDAHVYMRFRPADYREKIWDHAAGAIVASEAGCAVSDVDGAPLNFSRGRFLDVAGGIVAAPPALHAAVLEAARSIDLPARPATHDEAEGSD